MANPNPRLDQPDPWEPDRSTCEAVQELTERLTRTVTDREPGESFTECLACGDVDSHGESCIVPALEAWLTGDTPTVWRWLHHQGGAK